MKAKRGALAVVWVRAEVRTGFRGKPFTVAIRTADGGERLVSPPLRDVRVARLVHSERK